jgi:WD40 repeat protein
MTQIPKFLANFVFLAVVFFFVIGIWGCSSRPAVSVTNPAYTTKQAVTLTQAPPTVTPSVAVPTATYTPRPEPVKPTDTPVPLPITSSSLAQIQENPDLAVETGGLILASAWSSDGKFLAVSNSAEILLLDGETFEVLTRQNVGSLTKTLAFSAENPTLLASGSNDGVIRVWQVPGLTQVLEISAHPKGVNRVAFQPGGGLLASAGNDALVYLWDLQTATQVRSLIGGAFVVPDIKFLPDGKTILTADGGVIRVREVETGRLVTSLRAAESVPAVCILPEGKEIINSIGAGGIQLWSLETNELVWELSPGESPVWAVECSPGGDLIVSGQRNGEICWTDREAPEKTRCLSGHTRPVGTLVFRPDGTLLVSGGYDGWLRFWFAAP